MNPHHSGSWIEEDFEDDMAYHSSEKKNQYMWPPEASESRDVSMRSLPPHSSSPNMYNYDEYSRMPSHPSDRYSVPPRSKYPSQPPYPGQPQQHFVNQVNVHPPVSGPAERSYHSEVPSSASHFTRHARRVYVGGIPPGHTQEDQVKTFLNEVISNCMDEDHTNTYILSIYMNHKKCFAFVELCSVELTQACLELDGIVFRSSVLKIQRANEYKPELLPSPPRAPVRFQASKAPFPSNVSNMMEPSPLSPSPSDSSRILRSRSSGASSSILPKASLHDVCHGSIVVIGFPYDEGDRRSDIVAGAASACRVARHFLRKVLVSQVNPEFGIDLSGVTAMDVGDVPLGLTLEDALSRLDDMVAETVRRGGVPIVIGGSGDMSYACTAGLISVAASAVSVMKVDSRLNVSNLVCIR